MILNVICMQYGHLQRRAKLSLFGHRFAWVHPAAPCHVFLLITEDTPLTELK